MDKFKRNCLFYINPSFFLSKWINNSKVWRTRNLLRLVKPKNVNNIFWVLNLAFDSRSMSHPNARPRNTDIYRSTYIYLDPNKARVNNQEQFYFLRRQSLLLTSPPKRKRQPKRHSRHWIWKIDIPDTRTPSIPECIKNFSRVLKLPISPSIMLCRSSFCIKDSNNDILISYMFQVEDLKSFNCKKWIKCDHEYIK